MAWLNEDKARFLKYLEWESFPRPEDKKDIDIWSPIIQGLAEDKREVNFPKLNVFIREHSEPGNVPKLADGTRTDYEALMSAIILNAEEFIES